MKCCQYYCVCIYLACNAAVLLKKFSGEEGERVDVQKLFGYIGLFTLVALWWLGKNLYHSCLVYAYYLCPPPDMVAGSNPACG